MFDRLTSLPHLLRVLIEPALHHLENVLMLPSLDPSLVALGAAVLDGTVPAGLAYGFRRAWVDGDELAIRDPR